MSDEVPEGDKVMLVLNSDLKYSSLALSFHFIVCFPWRSKVSGTESHKARHSSVLTLAALTGQMMWQHYLENIDGFLFLICGLYTKFQG